MVKLDERRKSVRNSEGNPKQNTRCCLTNYIIIGKLRGDTGTVSDTSVGLSTLRFRIIIINHIHNQRKWEWSETRTLLDSLKLRHGIRNWQPFYSTREPRIPWAYQLGFSSKDFATSTTAGMRNRIWTSPLQPIIIPFSDLFGAPPEPCLVTTSYWANIPICKLYP